MRTDLTGKQFGHLKVLNYNEETKKWICQCDCGKITEVMSYNLRLGNTKSCGHLKNGKGVKRHREINIMNEQIGQLLVTDVNQITGLATCKCLECKRIVQFPISKVVEMKKSRKKSITCGLDGCVYKRNERKKGTTIRKNTRFGELVVLERLPNKVIKSKNSISSIPMYLCLCSCGKKIEVQGRYLIDGRTKSCGCLKKKNFIEKKEHGSLTATAQGKKLYEIYINWQKKYRQPTNAFKTKVIDKDIKFFPELKDKENSFARFYSWAILNDFNIKEKRIYLDRKDYEKDFSVKNCFWTKQKTRGY